MISVQANGVITFTLEQRMYTMTPNWKPFLASVGGLLNCIPILEEVTEIDEPDKGTAQSYNALQIFWFIIYTLKHNSRFRCGWLCWPLYH